jgi:prepilin signal peptidase PulO-like enzyme (type II secretory pathway)
MAIAIILLAVLGLIFGSFVNALVWRLHKKKDWVKARSQCTHCGHTLTAADLIPVISWLILHGRCRYCRKPISAQYPIVELAMALVFILSYAFWPEDLTGGQRVLFISWLAAAVGLMALLVYDVKHYLLPSKIIYPTLAIAAVGRAVYIAGWAADKPRELVLWGLSIAIASGIFLVLFLVSKGEWIGYGDVRLGLVTGTLLGAPDKSFLMIFMASVLGIIFVAPSIISKKKALTSKLPYGPFLITATAITILFGPAIIEGYKRTFLP